MSYQEAHGRWIVWLSLLAGVIFQIMPLPTIVEAWRPEWVLLVLIYWAMALPYRYNIMTAWVIGVIVDVLLGAALGLRALAFSLVIYVVVLHFQRLRNFPMWQQALVIFSLLIFNLIVIFWGEFILGNAYFSIELFLPAISSAIFWPWVFMILRKVRRIYRIR